MEIISNKACVPLIYDELLKNSFVFLGEINFPNTWVFYGQVGQTFYCRVGFLLLDVSQPFKYYWIIDLTMKYNLNDYTLH